jgi:ABC-type antimicrobial peptide transport system permease subunit
MLNNYLKVAFRNLLRYKGYTFINIAGLAVGMACCIILLLWVQDELNYDLFHENSGQIYRLIAEESEADQITQSVWAPNPAGAALTEAFPEITTFARYRGGITGWHLNYGEKSFVDERMATADASFFEIFSFPFVIGDPKTALQDRYSIVITESLAKKCFGNEDPIGKVVQKGNTDLKVTAVIEDLPRNSHIQFDYIFPIENMTRWWHEDLESWQRARFITYLQLTENAVLPALSDKIQDLIQDHDPDSNTKLSLQSLKHIHLHSSDLAWDRDNIRKGNILLVYIFSMLAGFILLIACMNFTNLSTAAAIRRSKEIGMRKVTGARRKDIIFQFLGESIFLSVISLLLALLLVELFLPAFNALAEKELTLNNLNPRTFAAALMGIALLTGLVSGGYPAFFLSAFHPAKVLKSVGVSAPKGTSRFRKTLIVIQNTLAVFLIILTIVIYRQLDYVQKKDLGFDKDQILSIMGRGRFAYDIEGAKRELLDHPNILQVTKSKPPASQFIWLTSDVSWEGKRPDEELMVGEQLVGYDYLETFDMEMVQGRYFSREFATDSSAYILNETAAKRMGLSEPLGKRLTFEGVEGNIIGVIKDFHCSSLHEPVPPLIFKFYGEVHHWYVCIKMSPEGISETLSFLEGKWKEFVPGRPSRYRFLDETIDTFYQSERTVGAIIRYFALLAIFISCLGLFGLASFSAERRTREIGIRKVLGATVTNIFKFMTSEFIILIVIANLIAWPAAYVVMNRWLQNFAYQATMGIEIFVLSGFLALLIALLSVGYQALRVATADPVKSLRYE